MHRDLPGSCCHPGCGTSASEKEIKKENKHFPIQGFAFGPILKITPPWEELSCIFSKVPVLILTLDTFSKHSEACCPQRRASGAAPERTARAGVGGTQCSLRGVTPSPARQAAPSTHPSPRVPHPEHAETARRKGNGRRRRSGFTLCWGPMGMASPQQGCPSPLLTGILQRETELSITTCPPRPPPFPFLPFSGHLAVTT